MAGSITAAYQNGTIGMWSLYVIHYCSGAQQHLFRKKEMATVAVSMEQSLQQHLFPPLARMVEAYLLDPWPEIHRELLECTEARKSSVWYKSYVPGRHEWGWSRSDGYLIPCRNVSVGDLKWSRQPGVWNSYQINFGWTIEFTPHTTHSNR